MSDINKDEAERLWVRKFEDADKPSDDLKSFTIRDGIKVAVTVTIMDRVRSFFGL